MNILDMLGTISTAATFAQAGDVDTALHIMSQGKSEKKIVVAYESAEKEREAIRAAIPLAERLNSSLLFARIVHLPAGSALKKNLIEGSQSSFKQAFHEEVEKINIPAETMNVKHIVTSDEFYSAVNGICRELKELQFAILQPNSIKSSQLHIGVPFYFLSQA
ncbi:hypothetical protein [Halodesulfovibrio marinisediminis]|uniref:Universal stress protein family protein n=1 Tax=Halodesulfovibrio marinisediminis DSM 17456 TaxID=1121457 RepID=A0A1N6DX43_9BACT|nr:hypothetical protein [Halodesulfovibrio marinisediminis]SIN75366.1 hypothetical protein SAMN02745161_0549 [Halodesulfovibrio marinisediminis DSM 17456]